MSQLKSMPTARAKSTENSKKSWIEKGFYHIKFLNVQ